MLPQRREDLLVQELGDESVVYDPVRFKAHYLNDVARLVLRYSDGKTSVAKIASLLQAGPQSQVNEDVVWAALEALSRANLLEEKLSQPTDKRRFSRRRIVAAGVAGVVVSIVVPSAAQAAPVGGCCEGGGQTPGPCGPACPAGTSCRNN